MLIRGGIQNRASLDRGSYALTVGLSEFSAHTWRLSIWAVLPDGPQLIGSTLTRGNSRNDRVVAIAACPGVQGWIVDAFTDDPAASAEIHLASSDAAVPPGVTVIDATEPDTFTLSLGLVEVFSPSRVVPAGGLSVCVTSTSNATVRLYTTFDNWAHWINVTAAAKCVTSLTPYALSHAVQALSTIELDADTLRGQFFRIGIWPDAAGSAEILIKGWG